MRRKILSLLLAAACVLATLPLVGCSDSVTSVSNYPVTVSGVKFVGAPSRVVCLSSTYVGIIYAMGYESQLIGCSADCEYSEASSLQTFGTASSPSVDLIQGNDVDVVIADDTISQDSIDEINAIDVPVVVIPMATGRTSFVEMYCALGAVFQGGSTGYEMGRSVANSVLTQLDDIYRLVENETVWNTCIILDSDMETFATGDNIISMVLELVGGFNVAKDSTNGDYSLSYMMQSDPDVIICPAGVESLLRAKSNLVGIPALDNFQVYAMDFSVFDDLYTGIVMGAWRMAYLLHPEVITEDVIPEGMLDEDFDEDVFTD